MASRYMMNMICDIDIELWKFKDIYFDEGPHVYTDSRGTKYTSVTTFVKQCGERLELDRYSRMFSERYGMPQDRVLSILDGSSGDVTLDSVYGMLTCKREDIAVDLVKSLVAKDKYKFCELLKWDEIAERYAEKNGMPVADVKAMWDTRKNVAAAMGTQVHAYMENLWKRKHYQPDKPVGDYEIVRQNGLEAYRCLSRRFVPIRNEFIVYKPEWALCGTIDFLCYDRGNDCIAILDWKTNNKIERKNDYQACIGPLNGLPDCNYTHYSAQLSTYKLLIERMTNLKVGELALVHLKRDGWEYLPCMDLSVEIGAYLGNRNVGET